MRHLLTAPFPLRQYRRAFPLSVCRKFINGAPQRIVCIGNPVPVSPLSKPDLMRTYVKYIVRNSMEKKDKPQEKRMFKGVRSLKRKLDSEPNGLEEKKSKVKEEVVEVKKELLDEADVDKEVVPSNLMIDDEDDEVATEKSKPKENKEVKVEHVTPITPKAEPAGDLLDLLLGSSFPETSVASPAQKPADSGLDVLDSILSKMEDTPVGNNGKYFPQIFYLTFIFSAPTTLLPYSYLLVPVDSDGNNKVLVRSRFHGRDMVDNPISIATKLQYIPQCGAEVSCNHIFHS